MNRLVQLARKFALTLAVISALCAMEVRPMKPAPQNPEKTGSRALTGSQGNLRALAHYRILRSIGTGGMSEVYLAYDAKLRRQVAIKVLSDHLVGNPSYVSRFLQEGRLSKDLTHPHIVKGFAFGRDDDAGKYFIEMEFIDGLSAQERLDREGRLPLADAARIVIDIARALEYLHHQRYVHRDIKPGNILIAPDGSAKLADLGVAKYLANASGLTSFGQGVGTPVYMPLEQSINSSTVDARSDLFALGATFYHLVTGHVPFPGDDEGEIAHRKELGTYHPARHHLPSLPEVIDTILGRLLHRDPRKRFSTALEFIEVLTASGMADGREESPFEATSPVSQPLAPTRADLKVPVIDTPLDGDDGQIWLLKYRRSGDGTLRKRHGLTSIIVRLFEEGALPEDTIAAREPSQVFRRLRAYPEFRNIARGPRPKKVEKKRPNPLREPRDESLPAVWQWRDYFRGFCLVSAFALLVCCSAVVIRLMSGHH